MRRLAPGLLLASVSAGLVSLAALVVYGTHAGWLTVAILLPLGWATVLAAHALLGMRARMGGLRRQFGAVAVLAAVQLVVTLGLCVALMFVSRHDAFFALLAAADAAVLAVWAARLLGRAAMEDVERVRATLAAVGAGGRSVRTGLTGGDELGRLASDVDAMIGRLEREEAMRAQLLVAVSHDLRTPLTSLRLLAEAIGDDLVSDGERRDYARRMSTNLGALSALVDDLFELTRLRSGELAWTTERVDLDALLREAVDALAPEAAAGAVAVRAELPPDGAVAQASAEKLQRVLFNLIQNAIRHTPPDGSVVVRATPVGDGVEVEVADTGAGIPADQRDRVFEPFFRGDPSRTDPGAGLGLAIARAIVEAHGGSIWLADRPQGTAVRFRLPATGAPAADTRTAAWA